MPKRTPDNSPDDLHARLKASAGHNRRSLKSEVLGQLRAFAARLPRVAHSRVTRYRRQGRA